MTEQQLQTKILEYLKEKKIYAVKTITESKNDVPDILACVQGKFVGIKIKVPQGKLSELQFCNLRLIEKSKGWAYVVKSLEEVKEILRRETNVH